MVCLRRVPEVPLLNFPFNNPPPVAKKLPPHFDSTDETDSSDPDFDPGVPEEELGPVVPRHRSRRAMRSVRPPKHLVSTRPA